MSDSILNTPDALAIPKPRPISVQVPLAVEAASMAPKVNQAQTRQAADNLAEGRAAIANVQERNLRAMAALSPVVGAKLAQMEQDEFAEGFLRHAQGEAVDKIAKEQPFGGIFGDGAAVRGARAAQQMAMATQVDAWVNENRGDLSRMTLDEQRVAVAQYVGTLGTGDDAADALTAATVMERLPAIMDNLARTHAEEQQHKAASLQADAQAAHAKALQSARNEVLAGRMSEASFDTVKQQALSALRPLPGQSPQAWRESAVGAMVAYTKDGNFEFADLIKDAVLQGDLTADEQDKVNSLAARARSEWLLNNPESREFTEYLQTAPTQIEAGRYGSKLELSESIDAQNRAYARETGSLLPYIDNEQRGRLLNMWDDWSNRAAAANAKANQKILDENTKRTIYTVEYAKGNPSGMNASGLDEPTKHAIEQAESVKFFNEQAGGKSAQIAAKLAVNGHVNKPLLEQINRGMSLLANGVTPSKEVLAQLQHAYVSLEGTPYAAAAIDTYFGDNRDVAAMVARIAPDDSRGLAEIKSMVAAKKLKLQVTPEIQKDADELVETEINPSFLQRHFGDGREIGAGYMLAIKDEMKNTVAQILAQSPNLSGDEVLQMAYSRTMRKKDMAGDYLISNSKPGQLLSALNDNLNVPIRDTRDTRINVMFQEYVKAKMPHAHQSYSIGGIVAGRDGRMFMTLRRDDGTETTIPVTAKELAAIENTRKVKEAESRRAVSAQGRTDTTNAWRTDIR